VNEEVNERNPLPTKDMYLVMERDGLKHLPRRKPTLGGGFSPPLLAEFGNERIMHHL